MSDVRGEQKNLSFSNWHIVVTAVINHLEYHVSPELVEEFLDWIVMKVSTFIRSADDRDHQLGIRPDLLITNRRLEQMRMFIDPSFEIERLERSL